MDYRFKDVEADELDVEGRKRLDEEGCPIPVDKDPSRTTSPFHWPLELPEVFLRTERPGFDAIVGNPPFKGGQHLTGLLGKAYREYVVTQIARGKRGSADLCAYFFLRAWTLLRAGGSFGLVAINTLKEGDTREVGLDQLVDWSCTFIRAVTDRPWPGSAAIQFVQVWGYRGAWAGVYILDDHEVGGITSCLTEPGSISWSPRRLAVNSEKSFQGSIVLGLGFMMSPGEAERLIDRNPVNRSRPLPVSQRRRPHLSSRPVAEPLGDQLLRLAVVSN